MLQERTKIIQSGQDLSESQMQEAIDNMMDGHAKAYDIRAFLEALADKGESVDEIVGAAKALRARASTIKAPYDALDCCGTGGDGVGTYNISTAVAIIAASCGVPVAKHGNRAASSKSGAADVLEAMGVNLDMPLEGLEEALESFRFAFLMAPKHHESMKHVAAVRKEIGRRTIFNLIGPLANPAGTRQQLIGVFDKKYVPIIAEALVKLGTKRAWVVHGADGLDEISISNETYVAKIDDEQNIEEGTMIPEDFDLPIHSIEDLKGGDSLENMQALRALLEGQQGAYRDIVLANTAAVLMIAKIADDPKEAVKRAAEAIDTGQASETLRDYIAFSRGFEEAA